MKHIYLVIKDHIQSQLQTGAFWSAKKLPDILVCAASRRVMHWQMQKQGHDNTLDAQPVDEADKRKFLADIKQLSASVPPGTVVIQGDINTLTSSEWLQVEHALLTTTLKYGKKTAIPLETLKSTLREHRSVPAVFNHNIPLKRDYTAICIRFAVLMYMAMFLTLIGSMASGVPYINNASTAFFTSLGISASVGVITLSYHCAVNSKKIKEALAEGLSATWDEVLAMKTFEDACLVGMLADCVLKLQKHMPTLPLPDFMAYTPTEVLSLLFSVNGYNGRICDENVERICSLVKEIDANKAPTCIVSGIDLSNLREDTSKNTTTQTAITPRFMDIGSLQQPSHH